MTGQDLRLVMLTGGYDNSRRLARCLYNLRIPFTLITMAPPLPRRGKSPIARYGYRWVRARIRSIGLLRRWGQSRREPYPVPEHYAGPCNGPRLVGVLQGLRPDYILMMGGGILSAGVIGTARFGVLNAHPGLLPWIRGMDVVRNSILRGMPLGVTGHQIDAGIDTGQIICRYLLPVKPGDTLEELTRRSDALSVAVMLHMVQQARENGKIPSQPQDGRFPLCRTLDEESARQATELIRAARPAELLRAFTAEGSGIPLGTDVLDDYSRTLEGHGPSIEPAAT